MLFYYSELSKKREKAAVMERVNKTEEEILAH